MSWSQSLSAFFWDLSSNDNVWLSLRLCVSQSRYRAAAVSLSHYKKKHWIQRAGITAEESRGSDLKSASDDFKITFLYIRITVLWYTGYAAQRKKGNDHPSCYRKHRAKTLWHPVETNIFGVTSLFRRWPALCSWLMPGEVGCQGDFCCYFKMSLTLTHRRGYGNMHTSDLWCDPPLAFKDRHTTHFWNNWPWSGTCSTHSTEWCEDTEAGKRAAVMLFIIISSEQNIDRMLFIIPLNICTFSTSNIWQVTRSDMFIPGLAHIHPELTSNMSWHGYFEHLNDKKT